jgi:succinyl-diaminopimelate desuccinylase
VITVNHRFAPDRTPAEAEAFIRSLLAPVLDDGDTVELVDVADGAAPAVDHPVLEALIQRHDLPVAAKLGWTDVARFAANGVPAANFGPGDSRLAHMADERVNRQSVEVCFAALDDLLRHGV